LGRELLPQGIMPKQKEFIRIYLNKNDHEKVEENHSVYHHRAHRHHQ
jgi:hypothetical protein